MPNTIYLFVPGNDEKKIRKSLTTSCDAIIFDLEDAVQVSQKDDARNLLKNVLTNEDTIKNSNQKKFIRINSIHTPWFEDDLNLLKRLNIDGLMLPKCEDASHVKAISQACQDIEIIPLIETAQGVWNAKEILQVSHQVQRLAFGAVDFALDIGVEWSVEGTERDAAMKHLVLASRFTGVDSPVDAVFPIIDDKLSLQKDATFAKKIGFYGKMVIHPKHIEWVQEIYQPTVEQIEWSKKVVKKYEESNETGAFEMDGKLIDLPVYKQAKKVLSQER